MGTLIGMGLGVEERLKQIKNIKQSNLYRQRKTKKSFVEEVSSMKTNKPNKKCVILGIIWVSDPI